MSDSAIHIADTARSLAPDMVRLRRDIHRHPELGWSERRTTYRITEALRKAGLEPKVRDDGVGLFVEVGSGDPVVGFRADIDALPILEQTGAPYRSLVDGVMHACGHDAHAAIAVGIALTLATLDAIPGTARILFQPSEEDYPSGAVRLIEEGFVDGLAAIMAFHVDPTIPPGTAGLRNGPITSAADRFHIRLTGPGGHTSRPDRTVDLIRTASQVVLDLPDRVRAALPDGKEATLVFGRINGGVAQNAIPTEITASGTIRVRDTATWRMLPDVITGEVHKIAAQSGAGVDVEFTQGVPPVDNDPAVIAVIEGAAVALFGSDGVRSTPQSMGSEDFSWYLEHVPGALIRLGVARNGGPMDLHSPTFDLDEAAIEHGIGLASLSLVRLMEARR
ncbi:MAG: amidohydrolase [Actinomycetota bacterium]